MKQHTKGGIIKRKNVTLSAHQLMWHQNWKRVAYRLHVNIKRFKWFLFFNHNGLIFYLEQLQT